MWTVGDLGVGAQATLTVVATVAAPGAIVNTAVKTAQLELDLNSANDQSSVSLNAAASANLSIAKTVSNPSPAVGETVTFNVIATNQGPSDATGVVISDALPVGLTFVSAAPSAGSYDEGLGHWAIGPLNASGTAVLALTARVAQTGNITNTASVFSSDQTDPEAANNTDSVTIIASAIADLAVTKTLTGPAIPGLPTTYTIVVTNNGPSAATGASVTDVFQAAFALPAWTCVATAGSACSAAGGAGNIATTVNLEAAGSATFTATGTIASGAAGLLVNTATVDAPAGVTDPNLINNSSTSSDQLLPSADLQIGKTGPAQATAGTNITYTITVTNAGPSDAASVSVADPTPTGLTFVSNAGDCTTAFPCSLGTIPPGVSRAITSTFAVPAGYTTPDPIVNPATVSSVTPDPAPGNNTATAMTAIAAPVMNLGITKTNGASTVVPGTVTTYTITVSNAGPSNAIGATVIDNLPAVLSGATWSCTGAGGATCNVRYTSSAFVCS